MMAVEKVDWPAVLDRMLADLGDAPATIHPMEKNREPEPTVDREPIRDLEQLSEPVRRAIKFLKEKK